MGRRQHSWTTFYNPRNGRVRIQACDRCGIAKGLEFGAKSCKKVSRPEHKMRKAGWQPVSAMPDFANAG